MVSLPNFVRRRRKLEAVQFAPVKKAFQPQVGFLPNRDITGWVSYERRLRFSLKANETVYIDEERAREWQAKGYGTVVDGVVRPVSDDELAEMLATVTNVQQGA